MLSFLCSGFDIFEESLPLNPTGTMSRIVSSLIRPCRSETRFFIARDKKLAERCPVKAMTATEFLRYWEDEEGFVYDEVALPPAE